MSTADEVHPAALRFRLEVAEITIDLQGKLLADQTLALAALTAERDGLRGIVARQEQRIAELTDGPDNLSETIDG